MPARKKPGKETAAHQPSLFEKISGQAVHISHEIATGTGHLLEVAADKFSAVKEKIINKIGSQTPSEDEPVVKKKAAKEKTAVKVKKVAVVKKKAVTVKAKQPLKKTANKKVAPKKATKKIARRK